MLRLPAQNGATRLVLIRHLDADESLRGRVYGALDVPLSPAGERRAGLLANTLADLPLAAVYSSPLQRALGMAKLLATGRGLVPVVHEGLRELDFGDLEGRTYEEIEANWADVFRSWMRHPSRTAFPGGESFAELRARVLAAVEEIRALHPSGVVAVVAHGGVVRAILADALSLPDDALFRLDQSHGGVSVVDWLANAPLVRAMNVTFV